MLTGFEQISDGIAGICLILGTISTPIALVWLGIRLMTALDGETVEGVITGKNSFLSRGGRTHTLGYRFTPLGTETPIYGGTPMRKSVLERFSEQAQVQIRYARKHPRYSYVVGTQSSALLIGVTLVALVCDAACIVILASYL